MSGLRVLVAEDHEAVRGIVVACLSGTFQVVGAVEDGEQLVEAATFFKPDVIVSDINMPGMDGFAARNELQSKGLACPFVFITMMEFEWLPLSSILEKPVAYVHKIDLFNELTIAIEAVASGSTYISKSFRQRPHQQ